jgi:hypothetical protein
VGQRRADGDEAGQVAVLASQSVIHPRPHAGTNECIAAGVQF